MPSTKIETYPAGTTEEQMEQQKQLKLQAGAISSEYTGSEEAGWELTTVWNTIGD